MKLCLVAPLRRLQPLTRWVLLVTVVFLPAFAIAEVRTWTDNTGQHKIEAEFIGLEGGTRQRKTIVGGETVSVHVDGKTVRLKQADGELMSIRFERLSDADKAYVRRKQAERTKGDLIDSLKKTLLQPVAADTTARMAFLVEQRVKELSERFGGRNLTLRFPIKNVYQTPPETGYHLVLGQPDFARELGAPDYERVPVTAAEAMTMDPPNPREQVSFVRGDTFRCTYPANVSFPLSREEALKIDRSSVLIVSGYIWVDQRIVSFYGFVEPKSPHNDNLRRDRLTESPLYVCACMTFESRAMGQFQLWLLSPRCRIGKVREEEHDDFDTSSEVFVSSQKSPVFHKPECKGAKVYLPQDRVHYSSREAAIRAGKEPCGSCKP